MAIRAPLAVGSPAERRLEAGPGHLPIVSAVLTTCVLGVRSTARRPPRRSRPAPSPGWRPPSSSAGWSCPPGSRRRRSRLGRPRSPPPGSGLPGPSPFRAGRARRAYSLSTNFRMFTDQCRRVMSGMTTCSRLPSGSIASTNGVLRSTRRPVVLSIFSTRSRTCASPRIVVVSSERPRRATKTRPGSLIQFNGRLTYTFARCEAPSTPGSAEMRPGRAWGWRGNGPTVRPCSLARGGCSLVSTATTTSPPSPVAPAPRTSACCLILLPVGSMPSWPGHLSAFTAPLGSWRTLYSCWMRQVRSLRR